MSNNPIPKPEKINKYVCTTDSEECLRDDLCCKKCSYNVLQPNEDYNKAIDAREAWLKQAVMSEREIAIILEYKKDEFINRKPLNCNQTLEEFLAKAIIDEQTRRLGI